GVLLTNRFAEPARDARPRLDLRDLVKGLVEGIVDQVDAVEGTNVDAELAARAEVPVHDGLGDVLGPHLLDQLPLLILDAGDRAVAGADRAIDAAVRMDDVLFALFCGDRVGRAFDLADPTADARVGDEMRHKSRPGNPLRGIPPA